MAKEIGEQIVKAGVANYVDTPVSGGVAGAENGTLSFFCGYSATVDTDPIAKRLKNTVAWMGSSERITLCGSLGAGLVSKIVNNYIGLSNIAVAAQGMAFGIRHGMDKEMLYKCIKGSSGDSWVMDFAQPVPGLIAKSPSTNGFRPGFSSRLCVKDISLGIKAAQEVGIDASMGEMAVKIFEKASQDPITAVSFFDYVVWCAVAEAFFLCIRTSTAHPSGCILTTRLQLLQNQSRAVELSSIARHVI